MRVSPSSLGKGLGTPNPKTAPPKTQVPSLRLRTGGQLPEPRTPPTVSQQGRGRPDHRHSSRALKPGFALRPLPLSPSQAQPPAPPPPSSPAESSHPRTCKSLLSVHGRPRQRRGPATPPLPPQLSPSGGVCGGGHSGGCGQQSRQGRLQAGS
ncbi:uncharacterized protein LOC144229169 [Crocuta crocuta]